MRRYMIFCAAMLLSISCYGQLSFTTLTTPTSQNLLGISFADTSTGYACGEGGTIIKTTNGGTTWTTLTTNTTQKLWDIKVLPNSQGQKIIAVGDNNTVIKSLNGGTTWTALSIPFQSSSFVFGIQCLDSLNYYACGGDFTTTSGAILKTTNGGASWTKTAVPASVFLDKVFMFPSGNGFAVGTNTSFSDGSIQKISSSGPAVVKTSGSIITNLWCNSPTNVIAVGLGGHIWRSIDGGTNWTSHSVNSVDLYSIQFKDSLNGYACGGSSSGNTIISTKDGGKTWTTNAYSFNGSLQSVSIIGNRIFIAGDQGKVIKASLPLNLQDIPKSILQAIYPNPVKDKIHISGLNCRDCRLAINDHTGRLILKQDITEAEIDVHNLPPGQYQYAIAGSRDVIYTGIFIKE